MKVSLIMLLLLSVFFRPLHACNVCGSSSGGFYAGSFNELSGNLIGLRCQYRSYTSEHVPMTNDAPAVFSSEQFFQAELWGRYSFTDRFSTSLLIPYALLYQSMESENFSSNGIGDISLIAQYAVIQKEAAPGKEHFLQIGAGIKLPTGKNEILMGNTGLLIPNMQPGTGSVDYLAHASYSVSFNDFTLLAECAARINGSNNRGYQFGHRANAGITAGKYFNTKASGLRIYPQLGLKYEFALKDYEFRSTGKINPYSGAETLNAFTGLDLYTGSWIVGAGLDLPLYQNISRGLVTSHGRISTRITYLF